MVAGLTEAIKSDEIQKKLKKFRGNVTSSITMGDQLLYLFQEKFGFKLDTVNERGKAINTAGLYYYHEDPLGRDKSRNTYVDDNKKKAATLLKEQVIALFEKQQPKLIETDEGLLALKKAKIEPLCSFLDALCSEITTFNKANRASISVEQRSGRGR